MGRRAAVVAVLLAGRAALADDAPSAHQEAAASSAHREAAPPGQRAWRLSGAVYDVAQTADGFLWFGTQAGLRRFDGVRFEEIDASSAPALADDNGRRLLAARDGSLWIATGSGFVAPWGPPLQ